MILLEKIGYFDGVAVNHEASTDTYPKGEIVAYLTSGIEIFSWLEDVQCMYGCSNENLGSVEISDGTWVWTKEFIHYVDCHHIGIPGQFLEFAKQRSYKLLKNENLTKLQLLLANPTALETEVQFSDEIWNSWTSKNTMQAYSGDPMDRTKSAPKKSKFDLPDDW